MRVIFGKSAGIRVIVLVICFLFPALSLAVKTSVNVTESLIACPLSFSISAGTSVQDLVTVQEVSILSVQEAFAGL